MKPIFDENWIRNAQTCTYKTSWASDVIANFNTTGGIYLALLRKWYIEFPLSENHKKQLASRLENVRNVDHLGAVNELAWWFFMQHEQLEAKPIVAQKTSTPDFQVLTPTEFFVEVSTVNVSEQDHLSLHGGYSVRLDNLETIRRILEKFTDEKLKQLKFAADQKKPCVLVLFDYTTWSAFGTQFYLFLSSFLFGKDMGYQRLPVELSALLYMERKVIDGRIAICRTRSAAYYNPNAKYALPVGTFASLNQFWGQIFETEIAVHEGCVWL